MRHSHTTRVVHCKSESVPIGCETTTDDRDTERSMISNPFLQMVTILSCKNTALYASEGMAKFCWTALITRNCTRDRLYAYSVLTKPSRTGKTELTLVVHANGFDYAEETLRLSPMRSARVDAIRVPHLFFTHVNHQRSPCQTPDAEELHGIRVAELFNKVESLFFLGRGQKKLDIVRNERL